MRWSRVLVLLAVTALLGNARCVDNCASPAPAPTKSTPQCPLHQQKGSEPAACDHQHPQFATIAADVQQLPDLYLIADAVTAPPVRKSWQLLFEPANSPPPSGSHTSVTILRL